ncbi:hypothetical protein [Metabacillus schmidteae]
MNRKIHVPRFLYDGVIAIAAKIKVYVVTVTVEYFASANLPNILYKG